MAGVVNETSVFELIGCDDRVVTLIESNFWQCSTDGERTDGERGGERFQ